MQLYYPHMIDNYPEDFDSWLSRVYLNDSVMFLIYQIYQLDMIGRINKESMVVSLKVNKVNKPVSSETLDQFSDFMASGALDAYVDHRLTS